MPSRHTLRGYALLALRMLAASAVGRRRRRTLEERLAQVPRRVAALRAPVRIRWNDHQVPFVEAEHDRDLAVGLGVVHAHLRLFQIEFMRRAAHGRLAEALGPAATDLDRVLRALDVTRAVPAIRAELPSETRAWLEGFADGINAVVAEAAELPEEFRLLGLRPARWALDDVLAVGRLAATDFTWKVWVSLSRLRGRPDWLRIWERLFDEQAIAAPTFAGEGLLDPEAAGWLGLFPRTGSNSVAVAAGRSASGAALMANDPHLSIVLPNLWLIAGWRSPGHHAVGLMLPGVPVMALGRNPWIAWGGTSLHAASSDLFDLGDLPPDAFSTRTESIPVRWSRPAPSAVRETPFGPVISDAPILRGPLGRTVALRWMGHLPSDETTAMLRVNRARNWDEFLDALDGWAVPALNMTYADVEGRVGKCMAARLPARPLGPPADLFADPSADAHWTRFATAKTLPWTLDPPGGVVASANERPVEAPAVLVGHFFAPADRVRRLHALTADGPVSAETLKASHLDVLMASAVDVRDRLLALADGFGRSGGGRLIEVLRGWDGRYDEDAAGPVALELLVHHFVRELHGTEDLAIYANAWEPWALLRQDLTGQPPERLAAALAAAVPRAAAALGRFPTWGAMHRLRLRHPFGAIPWLGRRFAFADVPSGGGNETLMKMAHGFAGGRHVVRLGAVARHVSDLADPDANDFVLLGGQDGWIGSTSFLDQFEPWRAGRYVRVPLRPETARATFRHETVLSP